MVFTHLAFESKSQCFSFTIQTTSETCSGCCDGTASVVGLSGGCAPYSFIWSPGGQITQTIIGLCPGSYAVYIQDSASCCSDTIAYCCLDCPTGINISSGIHDTSPINAFVSNNLLSVENLNEEVTIELFDIVGRKIFKVKSSNTSEKINMDSQNQQIYLLVVTDKEKNIIFRKKIIW